MRKKYSTKEDYIKANRQKARERWNKIKKEKGNGWWKLDYQKKKEFLLERKKTGCYICGETEPCVLDFHHIDTEDKEFGIGGSLTNRISFKKLEKEIEKCIVVCANCHRKIHAGIIVT